MFKRARLRRWLAAYASRDGERHRSNVHGIIVHMELTTGLQGVKTAAGLVRSLRDAMKQPDFKAEEWSGRISEVYDYIADSKDALVDAKDEIADLKEQVAELEAALTFKQSMKFASGAYWTKDGGPYCQLCWEHDGKAIGMLRAALAATTYSSAQQPEGADARFSCNYHREIIVMLPASIGAFRKKVMADES